MSSNLYVKNNYTSNKLKYIKNTKIIEYDMKDAGYNILKYNNVFDQKTIKYIDSLSKNDKNIFIGKYQRENKNVATLLMKEFERIRKEFFELNQIEDNDVLSIKKDAIFLIDKICNYTTIDNYFIFANKNTYNSYFNIDKKEFYFNQLKDKLDVKGVSDYCRSIQENYLFKDIKELLILDSSNKKRDIAEKLLYLKYNFINLNLDNNYYLDLNTGKYIIKLTEDIFTSLDDITDDIKNFCFIDYNFNFILSLISLLL